MATLLGKDQLLLFGGRDPFKGLGNQLPVGWPTLFGHLASFADRVYIPGVGLAVGEKWQLAVEASQTLDDDSQSEIRQILAHPESGRPQLEGEPLAPRGLSVIWVVDRTLNAWVARLRSRYVLALHIATPFLLRRFYQELVKEPAFFPEVDGEAQARLGGRPDFQNFDLRAIAPSLTLEEAAWWALDLPAVIRKRFFLAELLTCISTQAFIAHEVGHILAGHCEAIFAIRRRALQELSERCLPDEGAENSTAMLMEIEADIVSMSSLVDLPADIYERSFQQYLDELGWRWSDELQAGLLDLCLRMLFGVIGMLTSAAGCRTHPHPASRLMAMNSSLEFVYARKGVSLETLMGKQYCGRFRSSSDAALDTLPYRGEWRDEGISLRDYVERHWEKAQQLIEQLMAERQRWKEFSFVAEAQRLRDSK